MSRRLNLGTSRISEIIYCRYPCPQESICSTSSFDPKSTTTTIEIIDGTILRLDPTRKDIGVAKSLGLYVCTFVRDYQNVDFYSSHQESRGEIPQSLKEVFQAQSMSELHSRLRKYDMRSWLAILWSKRHLLSG